MELTKKQIYDLAREIFNESFPDREFGEFENQGTFVQNDWIKSAYRAVEGYNTIAKYVDFSGISIVTNCCLICRHVDLHRPACNLRGDDIDLECVCSKFELFEFYEEEDDEEDRKDKKDKEIRFWERIRNSNTLNEYDPFHY